MAKFTAVILAGVFGLVNVAVILACNCEVKHPQTQYKEADFVVKAKVLGKYRNQDGPESSFGIVSFLEYPVEVSKFFKGRRLFDNQVVSMWTPEDSSCGIKSMKPGHNYLISGHQDDGAFYLNVCSWVEEWSALTKEQRKGLKTPFASRSKRCDVPSVSGPELIMTLVDPRIPADLQVPPAKLYSLSGLWTSTEGQCTYNPVDSWQFPTSDCETLFTYCIEDREAQCAWQLNRRYKECFIDRETAWVKRELRRSTLQGRAGVARLRNSLVDCPMQMPEQLFNHCVRSEVARLVTQFL